MSFRDLVADLDYPMYVVTVAAGEGAGGPVRDGCLAGFVTQASIDPPRLLVLLSKANRTWRVAQGADVLVVHFLHRDNGDLAAHFGEETGDEIDKFAGVDWEEGPGGAPVLRGTRGWVAGRILARVDAGDHEAHLLDVRHCRVDRPGPALGYQAVRDLDPGHPA